jgi:internalin A
MNSDDLNSLKKIEKTIDLEFSELDILDSKSRGYLLNNEGKIKGLSIFSCGLENEDLITLVSYLRKFESLEILHLSQNYFSDISPLSELQNLKVLRLPENQIINITSIGVLKKLEVLDLWYNQINDISPLSENKNIKILDLWHNQISDIKPVGDLKRLSVLDLAHNQINDLTPLTNLRNINKLNLSNNEIRDLNPIINLNRLEKLYLARNKIADITPLQHITKLSRLDLRHNPVKQLPSWITNFNMDIVWKNDHKTNSITLFNNPITDPPTEIVKQGKEAIRTFFESLEEEGETLFESKLVIVGRGFTGKTVLAKKLLDINYKLSKHEDTTKGVVVIKEPLIHHIKEYKTDFKYHIWDFGGQEKYDATHQFFITENSLYLFVHDARQESDYLDFDFWLNTIDLFASDAPVIVVLSKIDERTKSLAEITLKANYKNIFDFEKVSCADGYEDTVFSLKKKIETATVERLKQIKFPSKSWKNVPERLTQLSQHLDYISYREYIEICKEINIDERKAKILSKYLHDLGFIIHKQDDLLLCDTVIINLDWCVDGVYKVLDDQKVFNNQGFFSEDDLKQIWSDNQYQNKRQELLNLMKKYRLCFELRDNTGYIAPDMLPKERPKDYSWNYDNNLFFEYRYDFMPAGLLCRFIVECHAFIKNNTYWKYGVEIEYENTSALIEEDTIGRKIKIAIRGSNKKGLLNTIRMFFKEVHSGIKALVLTEMIPCNCKKCSSSLSPHFYKYSVINEYLEVGRKTIVCDINPIEDVEIQTLIDDVPPNPSHAIIKDIDLQKFIRDLLPNLEHNIMHKDGYMYLWRDQECAKKPKQETKIQSYITNFLDDSCESKGIQVSREVKISGGSIDILFSYTTRENTIAKTCIEIKKSDHADVETAIKTQLPTYLDGLRSKHGIYLVLWFKNEKFEHPNHKNIQELEEAIKNNIPTGYNIEVKIINCNKPIAPSKQKTSKPVN